MTDYEGELAGNILLEDGEDVGSQPMRPLYGGYGYGGDQPPFGSIDQQFFSQSTPEPSLSPLPTSGARGMQRRGEAPSRTPDRTPSPVYQWNNIPKKVSISEDPDAPRMVATSSETSQVAPSSTSTAPIGGVGNEAGFGQMPLPFFNPYWTGGGFNPQAYYAMMMQNSGLVGSQGETGNLSSSSTQGGGLQGESSSLPSMAPQSQGLSSSGHAESKPTGPQGSAHEYMQMILAMQAMQAQGATAATVAGKGQNLPSTTSGASSLSSGAVPTLSGNSSVPLAVETQRGSLSSNSGSMLGNIGTSSALSVEGAGKRTKNRGGAKEVNTAVQRPPPVEAAVPKERGGKNDRRGKRGGVSGAVEPAEVVEQQRPGNSKKGGDRPSSSPIIEQLKARERNVELSDLTWQIAEIAQDQYGSRLIQQKLEVANEEEKQRAFKAILQKMPQLTCDVFGNYVIQKFFEYGNAEQRRILAEQLVGQVLKLSHQMYGCRVVQKALDSVPIEQQVLLIGELKGHVLACIEDQHGNHVIQKCIERLPTDRISFIVEAFNTQTTRMAKHCYGCRVIQRLIEYCSSQQISPLLDEVLRNVMELGTDQYGNYVVQHVMEHSSRKGDREMILGIARKNINMLSCHKYASNVIEKALSCSTPEEKGALIMAIVGEHGDAHPPLLNMMRDRFGNYIVQRSIALALSPQREALLWKLHEQMPQLKKSNTYGKHIISALEKAQAQGPLAA
mmetsp:Transcript_11263/g.18675  ORF Transcript_11263/g.18675 Transcript_11263/m.18675 type:complete len:729 (-) Transcript_11263:7-2193(-)